jgi:hypothetical protein
MHSYVNNIRLISVSLVMLCKTLEVLCTLRQVLFSSHFKPNALIFQMYRMQILPYSQPYQNQPQKTRYRVPKACFLLPQSKPLLSLNIITEYFTVPSRKARTMSASTVNCQTVIDNPAIVHLPNPNVGNQVPPVESTILPTGFLKAHLSFQDPMVDLHKNCRGTSQGLSRGSTLSNAVFSLGGCRKLVR